MNDTQGDKNYRYNDDYFTEKCETCAHHSPEQTENCVIIQFGHVSNCSLQILRIRVRECAVYLHDCCVCLALSARVSAAAAAAASAAAESMSGGV